MPPAIPIATYRLQLSADFDFDAAAAVVPYLKTLGITHLYASPFMKARKGSTHGYDIIDHAQFNPELGGETGFERLSAVLKQYDLGLILDFVPNHVGVHFADNPWWLDVLEWGPASPHAVSFDIDWDQLPYRARGGVRHARGVGGEDRHLVRHPAGTRVAPADLLDDPDVARQVELRPPDRPRQPELEETRVRHRLEERPRQLALRVRLRGGGTDQRPQGAGGLEGGGAHRLTLTGSRSGAWRPGA